MFSLVYLCIIPVQEGRGDRTVSETFQRRSTFELICRSVSSPWGWQCEFGRCVKKEIAHQEGLSTLNTCKLTCGSSGALWPIPSQVKIEDQLSLFLPNNIDFQFNCPNEVVNLMNEAGDIFKDNILRYHPEYSDGHVPWTGPWDASTESHILYVNGLVTGDAVSLNLNTDESYQLNVTTSDDFTTATIVAASFFGARHALETLSQLIEYHETSDALMVVAAQIEDSPVFPYRGILLDTSRNFVSVATLERTLDAMGASKLNTLHWHITDTHSFPLVLESLPNMAAYGAYSSRQVYTFKQVVDLKEYARVRGVRLLPELDAPAHVGNGWQWGHEAGLGDLAVCVNQEPWQEYCVEPPCGQLNLANPSMYHVLGQLYVELVKLFSPLDMFHFGGDEKLKDLTCAHENAVAVSNRFDVLGALEDPVELRDTFKRETLQAAKECIGERPRSRRGFVPTQTLEKIEESRAARLTGSQDQHRALSRRTRTLLWRDKERYVSSLAENVEGHLNANNLQPTYRALKKLRSMSSSRASAIRTADGRLVSDRDGQMARWAEYFGQLFTVDPPTEQLHTTGLQAVDADPPIDETTPSFDEVREAVSKLRGGKAAGVCNISAELLKAGGEAMIRGLHAVLTAVWQ
ncbi:Chitooligosaccharidolytic beta-N-acetylglucosaminidase [Chionoecetes opilio]|uniref:beta-N-acetylhexosaminidase n=1 Tax=Chionoecetes opilio TaxID=41210 RepID=A0A8J4Y577_CHIOP|nr:Chitooligosaccharidolytic beta-N-acetylglucosaminidase [Chionoecetes opilio]